MPMLAADMASTTAKPSMILPRNRKVGSFGDIDCEPTQDLPAALFNNRRVRKRALSESVPIIRAEWIKGRKFTATAPHPEERPLGRVSKDGGVQSARWFETREDALLTMRKERFAGRS